MKNILFLIVLCISLLSFGCIPQPQVEIIAFGDSSTIYYPSILADKLNMEPQKIANEAKGGEITSDGIERMRGFIMWKIYPNAHTLIYWQGGNDLIDLITKIDPLLMFSPNDAFYPFKFSLEDKMKSIEKNVYNALMLSKSVGWQTFLVTYYPIQSGIDCKASIFNSLTVNQAIKANEYQDILNEVLRRTASTANVEVIEVAQDPRISDINNYLNCNHLNDLGNNFVAEDIAMILID